MNSERDVVDKPTTTVALDYGEILLDGDEDNKHKSELTADP